MKEKVTVCFRRTEDGVVLGEVLNMAGEVIAYRNHGRMTDEEINNVIQTYKAENPGVNIMPAMEVAGN